MDTDHMKDLGSTIAGGGAAMWLVTQVRWEAMPYGEYARLGTAFAFLVAGYLMYRLNPQQ